MSRGIVETTVWAGEKFQYVVYCPVCGYQYSHHSDVEVFERFGGEDGPSMKLRPGSPEVVLADENENPSPRRHAVRIHFDGECAHMWVMDISETFIMLRGPAER